MKRLAVALHPRRHDDERDVKKRAAPDVKKRSSKQQPPAELHVPANVPASVHASVPASVHASVHASVDANVHANVHAYSSSSSDGSVVQTPEPDDDPCTPTPPRTSNRWSSWIRSRSTKQKPPPAPVAAVWEPPTRVPVHPSPPDSDDDSDHYDDDDEPLPPPPPVRSARSSPSHSPARSARVLQPATALRAQMNIRAITLGSIIPPLFPPPLLHLPSGPLFPRSSNPAPSLQSVQTTRTIMHKTAILRRLESQSLSRPEIESIAAFGHRPKHLVPKTRRRALDEDAMSDVRKVRFYSRGLQVWFDRPCFEERCVLWTWDADGKQVVARRILGSEKAVASLEFSEGLEALAGYGLEPFPSLTTPMPVAPSKNASLLPPLRITSPPPLEVISAGSSTPNASTGPSTPTTVTPLTAGPRKILRFLPDPDPEDEEDNVPLGYQVLTKRENERIAEERERQAREEERMKKVYVAEVAAARARREGARAGSGHEVQLAKDRRSSYTRPAYDPSQSSPRRIASEPDSRPRSHGTSRPASIMGGQGKSRPSSIRSERTGHGSSALRTPPLPSPPPHSRSQTMPSNDEMQEAKRPRPTSTYSEAGASTRSRYPSAPSVSAPSPMHARTLPRSYSSGSAVGGTPMMPMPPVPPVPVMAMPMFVMPGVPQFYMQQPMSMQQQHLAQGALLPPMRPGLPVSRSAEGLVPPRAQRHDAGGSRPAPSPRRSTGGVEDVKRASRMSVQVPPVSFRQSAPVPAPSHSHSRSLRPTPLSR